MATNPTDNPQMDVRLKNLFTDLESSFEPVEGQPEDKRNVKRFQDVKKPPDVLTFGEAEGAVCPFLKTIWDNTARYGYPHTENACYKQQRPKPVSLAVQKEVCLTKQYNRCPLDLPGRRKNAPLTMFYGLKGTPYIRCG